MKTARFSMLAVLFLLTACGAGTSTAAIATVTSVPVSTSAIMEMPTPSPTGVPGPTDTLPAPLPCQPLGPFYPTRAPVATVGGIASLQGGSSGQLSPDRRWAALYTSSDSLVVGETEGGRSWEITCDPFWSCDGITLVGWSPDSNSLYYSAVIFGEGTGFRGLGRLTLATGELIMLIPEPDTPNDYRIKFSPDGRFVAYWWQGPTDPELNGFWILDLVTLQSERVLLDPLFRMITNLVWNPGSDQIALDVFVMSENAHSILLYDPHTRAMRYVVQVVPFEYFAIGSWRDEDRILVSQLFMNVPHCHGMVQAYYYLDVSSGNFLPAFTPTP